ncbi:MAG TPA: cell division protein ZapE [Rhizomicrobium sp.]|nr:cell division protein ZapE [Rhizomicrobium sp.]
MLDRTPKITLDPMQAAAAKRLDMLARALRSYKPGGWSLFGRARTPCGLYIWGDVGRGKSMLMDMFFDRAPLAKKRRVHFNAFMLETHARIHEWRSLDPKARARRPEFVREAGDDPIAPVAHAVANEATLLCFDEFQVTDVADAMILGRLFEQLFQRGVVIVATSNTAPARLYEGGLNRQLFLPFIAMIERHLDVVEINGPQDYRLLRMKGVNSYITPLGPDADRAMNEAWFNLTGREKGTPRSLRFLGRELVVPEAAGGFARFSFADLCQQPLGPADYLEIARNFATVFVDRIPRMGSEMRNEARRFILLIDTFYDEGVHLVCSAAAPPEGLYTAGDGADAFRRTASRLVEMQSEDYLKRGHGWKP